MSSEESKEPSGYRPGSEATNNIRKLQLEHTTARLHLCLQYGILLVGLGLIVFLSLRGKLDSTVSALVATLLGYVLRGTVNKTTK
jgi:hypothetical protein